MTKIQRRVFISGRVQGVGFRASTVNAATQYSELKGYVRNLPDGRVEAVFAGAPSEVNSMTEWCKKGPRMARVDHVELLEETYDPKLPSFDVMR